VIELQRPDAGRAALAYAGLPRPLYTRLPGPIDYRIVPMAIRTRALRWIGRMTPRRPRSFPEWPIDRSLDDGSSKSEGDVANLILTHDVDTRGELDTIPAIRSLERDLGLPSAFGFVPDVSWPDEAFARALVDEGCEVYWHDIGHDGRLPFLGAERIRLAFDRVGRSSPWALELMRAFRSGQVLMSPELLTVVAERFEIDLSIPDTERDGPYGTTAGCGTVRPFLIGRLLELPLTLPQDVYLRHVYGMTAQQTLELWKLKINYTVQAGGVAVLNTHPMWVNPSRPDMWVAYATLLAWVLDHSDIRVSTPTAAAAELRRISGLTDDRPLANDQ
jgi:hypothetical protein